MNVPTLLRAALLAAVALAVTPAADAQILDGTWFKVTARMKGQAVEEDGSTSPANAKGVFYVNFEENPIIEGEDGSIVYDVDVVAVLDGNAFLTDSTRMATIGADEQLMVGAELGNESDGVRWTTRVPGKESDPFLQMLFLAQVKVKRDKEGALKSARFKSVGGTVPYAVFGIGPTLRDAFGSVKLSGKLVKVEDLPFEV